MKSTIITFLFAILFSSITIGQERTSVYKIPDLLKIKRNVLYLDDFIKNPEFIPLETKNECLIDMVLQIDADSQKIYILDRRKNIFIFSSNGLFLKKISPEGKGPGQFVQTVGGFVLFSEIKRICIFDDLQRKLLIYNSDGVFLREMKISIPVQRISKIGNSTLLFFSDGSFSNKLYHELSFFDISRMQFSGEFKIFSPIQRSGAQMYLRPGFTTFRDEALLSIPFNDTVYRITSDNVLPSFIFKLGPSGIPKEIFNDLQRMEKSMENYVYFYPPTETQSFLFLAIIDHGKKLYSVLNKFSGVWKIAEMDDSSEIGLVYRNKSKTVLPMHPCSNDLFYSTIYAHIFVEQFASEFPSLVKKIKADDNPILIRARLK